MQRKSVDLIYGLDDRPPWKISILLSIQYIFAMSYTFILPVVLINEICGTMEQTRQIISIAMLTTGIGTILQGINRGPLGSGYLAPVIISSTFLPASIMAVKTGGLPLVFGMTLFAGICQILLSLSIKKLQSVFTSEVTGTIILMLGISLIPIAIPRFLGVDKLHSVPYGPAIFISSITLMTMIAIDIWGRGKMRLYAISSGLIAGYLFEYLLGLSGREEIKYLIDLPLISCPQLLKTGIAFNYYMILPFIIAMVSGSLSSMGAMITCQKANDANWKRSDMQSISKGIMACGAVNILCGISGTMGQSIAPSTVGLTVATGATSRIIGYITGTILIAMAFLPKIASIFVIIPSPVTGSILIYAGCFLISSGISIITSRKLDSRKIFLIGISIIFGMSVDFNNNIYKDLSPLLAPLFSSSLAVTSVFAIILNIIFRLGISKKTILEIQTRNFTSDIILDFMEKQGGLLGVRKEIIDKASFVMTEFMQIITVFEIVPEKVNMLLKFDEFNLDIDIYYTGPHLKLPDDMEDMDIDPYEEGALPLFLISKYADKVTPSVRGEENHFLIHFEH